VVLGTRPDIIKLGPVCRALQQRGDVVVETFWTGQHIELADGLIDLFGIDITHKATDVMEHPRLTGKASAMLNRFAALLGKTSYDHIVVQGDTLTAMVGAIAGFLERVPVAHVEAGLRTYDLYSPWPEEFSRRVVSVATTKHFAPTAASKANLLSEGIADDAITVTGNTVVDALQFTLQRIQTGYTPHDPEVARLPRDKKLVLVTGHRRENFGEPMKRTLSALRELAEDGDKLIVFPVHLNPNVRSAVAEHLGDAPNIRLLEPLRYPDFVYLMSQAWTVITDSGGIQEEAPTFGMPIVITREVTERPEVVEAGFGRLVGSDAKAIVDTVRALTRGRTRPRVEGRNPFGDGRAAELIATAMLGPLADQAVISLPVAASELQKLETARRERAIEVPQSSPGPGIEVSS
jgi:UDP-N-acetylglucosamine 2-epimerase